ncbi:EamA family transporter RarD [Neptunomonas japonica]|uniref:EamA family transporter RarD n=1 Tax=Neptunomonas japonica TaxID=417574 RepID=UPI00041617B4|nr:EamA family transporter RarD [Neptunomonas japonica]
MTESNRGLLLALFAYSMWGSFVLFFSLLKHIPATEVLLHRVIWSFLFVAIILTLTKHWGRAKAALLNRRLVLALFCSSLLIATNWGLYIWAVSVNRAVDASLGYFINPLVAICLGVIFFKESLAVYQKVAILVASLGVAYKIIGMGELPWIALTLAISFGLYGLVRKKTQIDTVTGLMLETILLLPFAAAYWLWLLFQGEQHFSINTDGALLILAGVLTALPLLAFSAAAHRLSLTLLGFMTYLAPTLQLLSAVLILDEPFDDGDLITFSMIWLALLIFSGGAIWRRRKAPRNIT